MNNIGLIIIIQLWSMRAGWCLSFLPHLHIGITQALQAMRGILPIWLIKEVGTLITLQIYG